ncbi:hypothetical protein QJS83_06865 [Bdellovibrio sp. 22V]|uniref:hypothetical protein n=1 Tax=Bdellovibrio TaxID=958 RepID=UPI00254397B0|nr:hypothetical protein [Bdellovibrio sp. 22V]WII73592.1 hypothetical protein QJS83_06865 [Bdellovibrio sp. 22V]
MKMFFVLASMFVAFSANAADRKVGNVIAVEREVPEIYDTCLSNMGDQDTTKPRSFYSCAIKYTTAGEIPVSQGRVLRLKTDKCDVHGEAFNGVILITFANISKDTATFEPSRSCLKNALTGKDYVKAIVYTLE